MFSCEVAGNGPTVVEISAVIVLRHGPEDQKIKKRRAAKTKSVRISVPRRKLLGFVECSPGTLDFTVSTLRVI